MAYPLCIRLPYLHVELSARPAPDFAKELWPGLPETDSGFKPGYPLAPLLARNFMRDARSLDALALDGALHTAINARPDPGALEELESINNFAAEKELAEVTSAESAVLEHAQRALLQVWAAEESALDVARLEAVCARSEKILRQAFLEANHPVECAGCAPDLALLPRWRVCVANAAFFLPPEAAVFIEGEMREELLELMEFMPARAAEPAYEWPENLVAVRAPLRRVLGSASAPSRGSAGLFERVYARDRLWLAWRNDHVQ